MYRNGIYVIIQKEMTMARKAVSKELIFKIADEMFESGVKEPGTAAIRNELIRLSQGGPIGSPITIQSAVFEWREDRKSKQKSESLESAKPVLLSQIPETLTTEILRAINSAAAEARVEVESRLILVQTELNALVESGINYELQIERLTESESIAKTDLNNANIRLHDRFSEVVELKKILILEQGVTSTLKNELTKSESLCKFTASKIQQMELKEIELLAQLNKSNSDLSISISKASSEGTRADVADARFNSESMQRIALEARVFDLSTALRDASGDTARASAAEASVAELRAQVEMLRGMLHDATNARVATIPKVPANFKPPYSLQKTIPSPRV